jgi:C-terminal processing protease CtpA/Prc
MPIIILFLISFFYFVLTKKNLIFFLVRRVERVECGLPADQADLKPGDYVVFINKTNVVMMAEDDVMELIK